MLNSLQQLRALVRISRGVLIFLKQIERGLRSGHDIGVDGATFFERKLLRHISNHELASSCDVSSVRKLITGKDF